MLVRMTTEPQATATDSPPRPLRRRANGRVIGGGAAETWIVLLLIVLGVVLLSRREAPSAPKSVGHAPLRPPGVLGLTPFRLVVAGFLLLVGFYVLQGMQYSGGLYLDAWTLIVGIVVILGVVLLRQGGGPPAIATAQAGTAAGSTAPAAAEDAAVAAEPRGRAPRSPLAWYTVAAALVAIGLLAIVDNGFGATVMPGQFFGAVLAVVGIGLVGGA